MQRTLWGRRVQGGQFLAWRQTEIGGQCSSMQPSSGFPWTKRNDGRRHLARVLKCVVDGDLVEMQQREDLNDVHSATDLKVAEMEALQAKVESLQLKIDQLERENATLRKELELREFSLRRFSVR